MAKWNNIGPYVAERLIYFRRSQGNLEKISDNIFDVNQGKIIISEMEFNINSIGKDFLIKMKPVYEKDWILFREHVDRIKKEEFFYEDEKLMDFKKGFEESKYFLRDLRESFKENPNKYFVHGKFNSFNEKDAYTSILNRFVKPLILFKNYLPEESFELKRFFI